MADIKNVIEALQCRAYDNDFPCPACAYYKRDDEHAIPYCDFRGLLDDVLELLKEQEAVEPKTEPSAKGYWYTCGACGWWLFEVRDTVHFDDRKRIHFCASCGKSVKWDV